MSLKVKRKDLIENKTRQPKSRLDYVRSKRTFRCGYYMHFPYSLTLYDKHNIFLTKCQIY